MGDFLDVLVKDVRQTIDDGYYDVVDTPPLSKISLKKAIEHEKMNPVIAEIKAASPSRGTIKRGFDPTEIARAMEYGGAVAISILTEPRYFLGNLKSIYSIKEKVDIPVLMKDIIFDLRQVLAASRLRADAILLIKAIFDRGYSNYKLNEMIHKAHNLGLEVLLETHTSNEFRAAIQTEADLIGINNRDLRNLKVNLGVTESILKDNVPHGKTIVSESGIKTPEDLLFLRSKGAKAFLIGSSLMTSEDIKKELRRFVTA
jgi:indole-3-glycerol phosphate synthase